MDSLLTALSHSYGLDWLTMVFGVSANYFLSKRDKRGIILNIIACSTSLSLAVISHQYGFTVSNALTMFIMLNAYMTWSREPNPAPSVVASREGRYDTV